MMNRLFQDNRSNLLFLLIVGLGYYFMISQYVDAVDDIMYSYVRENSYIHWDQPVTSFYDIIKTQTGDYADKNGRIFTHTLVMMVMSFKYGTAIFFIVSSIMFVLTQYGMMKLIRFLNDNEYNPIFGLFILILLVSTPGQTLFGNVSFTMNYMFSSTMMIWALYFFLMICRRKQYSRLQYVLICCVALCGSLMHEGFSLPVSGLFVIYLLKNWRRVDSRTVCFIIIYWIGTSIVSFAPANFARAVNGNIVGGGENIFVKAKTVLIGFVKGELLVQILLILSVVIFILRHRFNDFYKKYTPFLIVALFSLFFDVFIAYIGTHQLTPIAVMLTIVISGAICRIKIISKKNFKIALSSCLAIFMIVVYSQALSARIRISQEWENMHDIASKSGVEYLDASQIIRQCEQPEYIKRLSQNNILMLHVKDNHYFEMLTSVKATQGRNPEKIKAILPSSRKDIVARCLDENMIDSTLFNFEDYYMLRLDTSQRDSTSRCVRYIYKLGKLGEVLDNLGRKPIVQVYEISGEAHSFKDSCYQYIPIFLNPQSIQKIWVEEI